MTTKKSLRLVKAYLERSYEILTAHDGFEGLHAFEEHENSIDLVITDLLMPDLSGVGVISILRETYPESLLSQSQVGGEMLKPAKRLMLTWSWINRSKFLNSKNLY